MVRLADARGAFPSIERGRQPLALPAIAEAQLDALLRATGIPRSGVYRPGEVCRLLRISRTTLLQLCALREHPAVGHPNPRGLGSFLVGCHHRIPHEALVEWLGRNQQYERESA